MATDILHLVHASPFYELTALLALAAIIGFAGQWLRQPMIVSFILAGILAGSSGFGLIHSHENIELLAELGVAVLLFLVGLKLDLKLVRTLGAVALATGLGQVLFTAGFGYLIGLSLGLTPVAALYVAVALTFSSTIIVVKLLSDKKEADSLHGRIAIGFLIVQDLVVVLAMMMLSAFGVGARTAGESGALGAIATVLLRSSVMLIFVWLFIHCLANSLLARIAKSSELLVTFAIAWAALLAALGNHVGFSKELGGLLAGVSLASTPFRDAIVARLASLRDFLLLFFFIALGAQLDMSTLGAQIGPALVFSVFVLIGNPLIVMAIMGYMGYRKRTGFLAGLTVAQISEFSLIFIAMGMTLGHVGSDAMGLVTLVGLITIALSVYMITYSHALYRWLEPAFDLFERKLPHREDGADSTESTDEAHDTILLGLGRHGAAIAHQLKKVGVRFLGIDFNPDEVRRWRADGFSVIYGDASDPEFIECLPLAGVKWVVSAMPQHDLGFTREDPVAVLIDGLKARRFAGKLAVLTQRAADEAALKARGVDVILLTFADAADRAVERIRQVDFTAA